ncbi:hypothetical protein GCM10028784_36470 [Myceligenerans cantabricum]
MVSFSAFAILTIAALVGFWTKKLPVWPVVFGVLWGIAMAATAFGPALLDGFMTAITTVVNTFSGVAGA